MSKCPCEGCKFYSNGKMHINPNAYDQHYCEKKQQSIRQHNGNLYHYKGQWILPCGGYCFEEIKKRGGIKMTDELLNALKLIKEECKKHGSKCHECPLFSATDECGLMESDPCDWKLQKREVYF